jgi:hypothetical protein
MDHSSTTFFVRESSLKDGPKVNIIGDGGEDFGWPITLKLYTSDPHSAEVTMFIKSEVQLINFVNSAIEALSTYRRTKCY